MRFVLFFFHHQRLSFVVQLFKGLIVNIDLWTGDSSTEVRDRRFGVDGSIYFYFSKHENRRVSCSHSIDPLYHSISQMLQVNYTRVNNFLACIMSEFDPGVVLSEHRRGNGFMYAPFELCVF